MEKPLITIREFGRRAGVSYPVARRLVLNGEVPSVGVGPRRRVAAEFVDDWVARARGVRHADHVDPSQAMLLAVGRLVIADLQDTSVAREEGHAVAQT